MHVQTAAALADIEMTASPEKFLRVRLEPCHEVEDGAAQHAVEEEVGDLR